MNILNTTGFSKIAFFEVDDIGELLQGFHRDDQRFNKAQKMDMLKGYTRYGLYRPSKSGTGKTKRRGRRSSSYQNARKIASLNKRVGGFGGLELKFLDASVVSAGLVSVQAGAEIDPTGLLCLNSMAQGDSESERLGRHIRMKSIQIRFHIVSPIVANAAVLQDDKVVFIALVLDKQTNAAQMNSEDVYENQGTSGQFSTMPLRDMEHTDRFRILWTKRVILKTSQAYVNDGANNFDRAGVVRKVDCFVNLRNMKVLFKGTTGTVANIMDNSLHVIAFTNESIVNISYQSRLRYTTM